ncbi:hypothetical protein LCGC14_1192260 [marine sediment metagenome]|uniref:Uncharacterized protein n=1 Tax=marine sediment metagenome TaxID=412755 RepID=A0A0F9PPD5_9ZZZZ
MTYSIHHRAEKQRQAQARFRENHEPIWVRRKEHAIDGEVVEMKELSRRGSGHYGMGQLKAERVDIIMMLGGACSECGMDDLRCLQIDHVNAGGSKDRQVNSYKAKAMARAWHGAMAGKYQVLCANCNWIKRYENNEHRMN